MRVNALCFLRIWCPECPSFSPSNFQESVPLPVLYHKTQDTKEVISPHLAPSDMRASSGAFTLNLNRSLLPVMRFKVTCS